MSVLAQAFGDSPPTRIAGNINHRCKGPVNAGGCRFHSRDSGSALDYRGIPTGCLTQRYWKYGFKAVNNIATDKQRYTQATFLHGNALQFVQLFNINFIQYRPHPTFAHRLMQIPATAVDLAHLANFFG